MASTTANEVANYILCYCRERGQEITHLKLQKLVYYAQGWCLAIYDEPLFDEPIQAWIHGAVQPDLYFRFKSYQWEPIDEVPTCPKFSDSDVQPLLDRVMDVYGKFTARQLELMIHREDPWLNARKGLDDLEPGTREISREDMKVYFRKIGQQKC